MCTAQDKWTRCSGSNYRSNIGNRPFKNSTIELFK